jgi:integrase
MVTKEQLNPTKLRTSSTSIRINKSTWEKHKPRISRDFYVRDTKLEGYYIRIRPNGKKTYCIQSRLGGVGRKISIVLGDCNLLAESEAREIARKYLSICKQGIHPKKQIKKEASKTKTILDFAEDHININKKLTESTRRDYPRRIKNCMPYLSKKPVSEITQDDVVDWWKSVSGSRNYQIAFIYARKALNIAQAQKYIESNPFADAKALIGNFPEPVRRQTHVPENELWNFMTALTTVKVSRVMHDLMLFLLLTGKRFTESASLQWKNVDFVKGIITLEKTKSGKVDVIPITKFLFVMLKSRKHRLKVDAVKISDRPHTVYVFPNRTGDGHIKDMRKSLKILSDEAGLGWTITAHDFRRTFSTACNELGMKNEEIAVLLNHAKRDVTEGYIIRNIRQKRKNLDTVQEYFNKHGNNALGEIAATEYESLGMWDEEAIQKDRPISDSFEDEMMELVPYS